MKMHNFCLLVIPYLYLTADLLIKISEEFVLTSKA